MADTLTKINPLLYIKPHDPVPEAVKDVAAWFETETMELDFGDWVGRPAQHITLRSSMLNYFFANGWYVDAVLGGGENGTWRSISHSESSATAGSTNSNESSSAADSSMTATGFSSSTDAPVDGAPAIGNSTTTSAGSSSGSATSSGQASSNTETRGQTDNDGAPFWYAYRTVRLKRRRLVTERVLQDMIDSFTRAYNEGREINNARYDELVSLYAMMLTHTEDEIAHLPDLHNELKDLADRISESIKKSIEEYRDKAGNIPDDWMNSRIDEINRKFDALVGQAKAKMVSEGTYNSTVWPTTLSGIERDRQYALSDLKDEMVGVRLEAFGKIATITANVGTSLIDAQTRISAALEKSIVTPTEIRNTVFKWMLDFMEKREDDYPGLDSISTIAERLGYAEGATSNPQSS